MILVDSSVWVEYFRGTPSKEARRLDDLLGVEPIAIGDLILTEVLQGFASEGEFTRAKRLLSSLPTVAIGGAEISIRAAENFRTLRLKGVTARKTIDTVIATRCIEDGIPLLFSDRDFDPFVRYLGLRDAMRMEDHA